MISHSKKGITLVELIVAMTLTSIFAVLCVMLINPIERTYKSTLKLARAQLLADTLVDSIRKEVDDVKHDDTTDVWIANLSGADDSQLIDNKPSDNKKTSGNTLVFRRNNNYTEAIYAAVGISKNNQDAVAANPLTPTNTAHSIDTLINSGKENFEPGIVHFGYYQAKEDDSGVFPIQPYDYTNPVMAKTYGEFTVKLNFSDLTLKSSKYPAYVMCKVTVLSKGKEFYSRLAVLCFAANGSGKGSGSHHTNPPSVRDIEVNVVWDDNHATTLRPQNGLAFTLRNNNSTVLGTHTIPDVTLSDTQRFFFKNINTSNGWGLAISPDNIPQYERTIKKTANGYLITYKRANDVMLLEGPTFYNIFGKHSRGTITNIIFAESNPTTLGYVQNAYYSCDAAIDKKTGDVVGDYKLYMVKDSNGNQTVYILSETGSFNGNPIMGTMFMDCTGVTNFTGLNLIDTSNTIDMHRVFYNCKNVNMGLFRLTWNTENVQTMDGLFRNFAAGTTYTDDMIVDISSFSFKNCKTYHYESFGSSNNIIGINKLFNCDNNGGNSRITKIIFKAGYKDARNIDMLQQVFDGCKKLKTIENFDNFDFRGATEFLNVFANCSSIEELNMSNWKLSSLQNIGPYTRTPKNEKIPSIFSGLSGMKTININNLDISSATNLKEVFSKFGNLQKVYMSEVKTNTEADWTMEGFFNSCTSLNTVETTNFVNSHCISLKNSFCECDSLTELDISGWNTSGVKNMSGTFNGSGVKSVTFPSGNNSFNSVETIASLFYNCTDLTTVDNFMLNTASESTDQAPSVSFPALTDVKEAFYKCHGLKNVKLKINAPVLEKVVSLFSNCNNLASVDMSNSDLRKAVRIESMLNTCGSLNKVFLNSVNLSACTGTYLDDRNVNRDCIFFGTCDNLWRLEMRSADLRSIKNLSSLARNSMKHIDMAGVDARSVNSLSAMFKERKNLNYLDISNVTWGAYDTAYQMFMSCENLQTLIMTGFVAPKNCKEMFKNCYNTLSLNNLGMDTSNVEYMDSMFENCYSLQGFNSTGWDTSNVKSMSKMFYQCGYSTTPVSEGTYTIDISNFDFSNVSSFSEMFNCEEKNNPKDTISTIILPAGDKAVVKTSAGSTVTYRMFRNRWHLTTIGNVEDFNFQVNNTDARSTFAATAMTVINLRSMDFDKIIGNDKAQWMFNDNKYLTTIYVKPDCDYAAFASRNSGKEMFLNDKNLRGQNNTVYTNNNYKGIYARIDVPGTEGFFSVEP